MISGEVVTPMILIGLDLLCENDQCAHNLCIIKEEDPDLCKLLRSVYSLEGLGIREDPINKADETFQYMERYLKLIQFTQEGVTTPFPLKDSIVKLKDNFNIGIEKILQSCINEGIIEVADDDIPQRATTFYLPHRGVWKPEKTTPLRIAFDASQKSTLSPSLNE
uniref:COR domain-containing protein n=1 Tax=Heterorhabditis bacteriophora TaxID=37862 RepID=A0A1I7WRH5_HETBA